MSLFLHTRCRRRRFIPFAFVALLTIVFVAMRADGDTYFVSLVEAREVPGQIEEYTVERLEVRGESVRIPYTMTTTTYATAGPGSTGEVDREVDVGALVCEPRTQGCVRE